MTGAAVELRGVSRRFRLGAEEVWAVRDVSLSLAPGEFLALIGRSGSGKTTLLNTIAGLDRPTAGEVVIDGERVDAMNESALVRLRRRKLGFVFQSFGLLPLLSAQENVELPLRIAGVRRGRAARARDALALVGLERRARHRPYELSGGEQQRVALARAFATGPALVLADEPTGNLDTVTGTRIIDLMFEIRARENTTLVLITHNSAMADRCDRVVRMNDGRIARPADAEPAAAASGELR